SFFTLRLQLSELLYRKNFPSVIEEHFTAFLGATGLHTFGLPRFNLCPLTCCEIERRQISARHQSHFRRTVGTTWPVCLESSGCHQHCNCNQSGGGNFNHGVSQIAAASKAFKFLSPCS